VKGEGLSNSDKKTKKNSRLRGRNRGDKTAVVKLNAKEQPLSDKLLFHILMDNITDNIYFKDSQSRFIRINRAMARYIGLDSPDDAMGKTDFDIFSEEHAGQAFRDEQKMIKSGKPIIGKEEKETWLDGKETWVSTTKIPIKDEKGNIIGTIGISRDITDKKRAEEDLKRHRNQLQDMIQTRTSEIKNVNKKLKEEIEERKKVEKALRENEKKYRTIFESFHDVYFRTDTDGIITIISPSVENQAGYKPKEVIGQHAAEFYMNPEARDVFMAELKKTGTINDYEIDFRAKDGRLIKASLSARAVQNDDKERFGVEGVIRDITYRKMAEKALFETKRQIEALVQAIPDIIYFKDSKGRYVIVNRAFEEFYGRKANKIIGKTDLELMPKEEASKSLESDEIVLKKGESVHREREFISSKGKKVTLDTIKSPLFDDGGNILGLVGVRRDITERKRKEEEIRKIAYYDTLTGLPNRILFKDHLELALAHARRMNRMVGILYMDLDHFKKVNDNMGHAGGDLLLQSIANRLENIRRESDTLSRIGGDEFLLLLQEISEELDAAEVAKRILSMVRNPILIKGRKVETSISIGISIYPIDGTDADILVKRADLAMYQAKRRGRDQCRRYATSLD